MIKKLPFPKNLLNLECTVKLTGSGISEEGEPILIEVGSFSCSFSEKSKVIINPDGTRIDLLGKILIEGDVAPNIPKISTGEISVYKKNGNKKIGEKTVQIFSTNRPRNPDGTIHHTTFEVM